MDKLNQAQLAYEDIRTMILKNQLKPGAFISESTLCEQLPYGRTPIRESLIRLSCDGLVNIHARRGIEVCTITPRRLYDIYELRQLVEPAFVRQNFDKLSRDVLSPYRVRFQTSAEEVSRNGAEEIYNNTQLDMQFHLSLVRSSGNTQYMNLLRLFFDYMTVVRTACVFNTCRNMDGADEHTAILDAILDGDVELTVRLLESHLKESYLSLVKDLTTFY